MRPNCVNVATVAHLAAIIVVGCGGGGSSSPALPPISVSLFKTSGTVQAGETANFTANVSNDPTNSGVKWSVTCPTASCGTVSPASTPSGMPATYTAPAAPPASNITVVVTAASAADPTKNASASVTFPAILVSVSPGTATVQASATMQLTANVAYEPSSRGISWAVSCPTAPCGTLSANLTASGTPIMYTAPATLPSGGATITITATSVVDTSKSSSATLIPVGHIAGYDVSVDYHTLGANYDAMGFIARYDQSQVRQMVQTQLQEMADRGASSIQTALWVENGPDFSSNIGITFPMTDQEQANLRAYAQDVASVVSASGSRLRLYIALNWGFGADYTTGSPTTTLGTLNLSPAEFTSRVQTTTDKIVAAVADVNRPDGVKVVDTIFFVAEANLPDSATPPDSLTDRGWFLVTNYPHFVSVASQAGIRPAVYFSADCEQDVVFDDTYVDPLFPTLNGHRSMFQVYRGVNFFLQNGLPLPSGRLDFDCYMTPTGATTYDQMLQRILDDADATMPSLGAPQVYDIPETYYLLDPSARLQYGQAFATQAAQNPRLQRVSFWTWPDSGGLGQNATYPFTIEDFLPPPGP